MGKSLKETAMAVLMKESDDPTPDRGAKSTNPNMQTLRPNSKYKESAPPVNPGAPGQEEFTEYEDLGPALTKQGDVPPSAKAVRGGKDTSKASQSPVSAEPMKKLAEEEEIEISEELQQFIEDCLEEGMSEEEIEQAISENFEVVDEVLEEEEELSLPEPVDMSEHVNALLAGENLSEEFKTKATTIFESAVNSVVQQQIQILEQVYTKSLEEQVDQIYDTLAEEVEDYLAYATENWIKENEVAIESGLRSEITEGFISGLRNLFAEHYIDVPEDKVDVVDTLGEQLKVLQAALDEEIERNVELTKTINESKKFEIMISAMEGLSTTEAERLKALAEGIEYTNPEEYSSKIETIKESYFSNAVENENVLDKADSSNKTGMISEQTLSRPMEAYVRTLGRTRPI